jgi:uncharacterized tellurite resistance protein B-like protein
MTPIEILATAVAYVIMGDNRAFVEEKAKMIGLLGKHVSNQQLTNDGLRTISSAAFKFADKVPLNTFIEEVTPKLLPAQRLCILINLYDVTLADGDITMGEKDVINQFRTAFGISNEQMQPIWQIIRVKNETDMFLKTTHPMNDRSFSLEVRLVDG